MQKYITFCASCKECPARNSCTRADWPADASPVSFVDFYNSDEFDPDKGRCSYFICNCSRAVFVGSSRHGNYYKCPVCGEEGEG